LEVDATRIDDDFGAPSWGIVCRLDPDSSDYYLMGIYNDGESFISRVQNGESNIVLAEARSSDVVRGRSEVNHIRADCVGSKLTLYVNDRRLLEAEDSEYASGQSGLFVRNDSDNGSFKTNVLFDDFSISSP